MRKLLEFISLFDWITPAVSFLHDAAEGRPLNLNAWTFYVPYDEAIRKGWSSDYIAALLGRYGVRSWGHRVYFGELFFRVKLEQAAWAEYLLNGYSVPIQKKSQGAPRIMGRASNASRQTSSTTNRGQMGHQGRVNNPIDLVDDFLTRLYEGRL